MINNRASLNCKKLLPGIYNKMHNKNTNILVLLQMIIDSWWKGLICQLAD